MQNLFNQKEESPLYLSFCTQKGGAGKSVFTTLAASYLHCEMGLNVAVIDCDYPQWSSIMQTRIPNSVRYDREQSIEGSDNLFLSTVFPPDKPLLKGSNWDTFIDEFLELINLKAIR